MMKRSSTGIPPPSAVLVRVFSILVAVCFLIAPTAHALCAAAAATTTSTVGGRRPAFYSDIVSPLAHTALRYAEQGVPVPATLRVDECILNDDNEGSIDNDDDCTDNNNNNDNKPLLLTVATFAGGCFWGVDLAFRREPGVLATCVGYTQGTPLERYPTYGPVCEEETGHTEAVLVVFRADQVCYAKLANLLFDRIPDPTMLNRVGRDRGRQYRTGLYAHSDVQLKQAQTAFDRENGTWKSSGRPVVTEVVKATAFWPAEEIHQRYLEKGVGGRFGNRPQSAEKNVTTEIRCYG